MALCSTPPRRRSPGRRAATTLVTAFSVLAAAGGLVVLTTAPASAGVTAVTFTDASRSHVWTVPQGVTSVTVDALGGSGYTSFGASGGAGAHVVATFDVTAGSNLIAHVAGNGGLPGGGANGGGNGHGPYGGGGGGSDLRTEPDSLESRILVAGGGGGAAGVTGGGSAGQAGGGDVDPPYVFPAQPGSSTAGGAGGVWLSQRGIGGSLGQGGDNSTIGNGSSSGGGGGYYGGGGGAVFGSGAGGSNYVDATATSFTEELGSSGAQPYVKITWTTAAATAISVTSLSLPADGTSTGTVTATVTDEFDQPVPGDPVTFAVADASVGVGPVTDHGDGTYSATLTASTTAGSYTVTASDGDASGTGTLTQTSLAQTITFASTPQGTSRVGGSYTVSADGGASGRPVTFSVDPSTTNGACTIDGAVVTFVAAGSCVIAADQEGNGQYAAATTVTQTVTVEARPTQEISITSQAPTGALVTDTYTVTATGGDSDEPVTFSSLSPAICTVEGSTVTFVAAGTCTVAADQAGDSTYDPAPQATQEISVSRIGATVSVAVPSNTVYGQQVTVSASVESAKGDAAGTVQFAVDGDDVGAPVTVDAGSATSPALTTGGEPLAAGPHSVTARFVPADDVTSAPASGSGTVGVDRARTRTAVKVGSTTLTATVTAVAPGSGTPTGTVTFSVDDQTVGTATLVDGVATLTQTVPSGMERHVSASYGGADDFLASSDSTVRRDPTITARLTSPTAKSAAGWYRSPVTVTFTCTAGGAPLTDPCPTPVVLSNSGAAQSVTRTVNAEDGGVATVSVTGIDIDRVAPKVKVTGVQNKAHYVGRADAARCQATDALSGVLSCTVKTSKKRVRDTVTVTFTATATDQAGNVATSTVRATVAQFGLADATYTKGAYDVKRNKTYTIVAVSDSQPRLLYAAPYPRKPAGGLDKFHRAGSVDGTKRWVLGVTLRPNLGSHRYWNLGVKTGSQTHVIKLRVS